MKKLFFVVMLTGLALSANANGVYRAKHAGVEICAEDSPHECKKIGPPVLLEGMQWYSDPWRVRIVERNMFVYYTVHKDDVEPALDKSGEQIAGLCVPGGGGIYRRTELGPEGQVFIKQYLITISCKDGKSYSTTKPLN